MASSDVPGAAPQTEQSVLRFAVAMRGGVSLAVWIGGAMQEIDHLRRDEDFGHHILGVTRFNRLEVDIITGASAGGLNAALAGMAIAHGTSLSSLRDVWMDTADIDRLLDMPRSQATIRSLLNGEYFRLEVVRWLKELASPAVPAPPPASISGAGGDGAGGSAVEIFLAATVFGGVPVVEATDPTFTDRRRQAYFHFRHLAVSPAFSDTCGKPEAADRMGRAARASASFPVAFDPVVLDAAAFSGRLQLPAGAPTPTTLRLFDGGILDNIPVARAIRAAAASPAQEPVRRWVVYLHPSPTLPKPLAAEAETSEAPHVLKVVADLLAGRGVETLLDDLEVLREHNREAESQRVQRYSACLAAFEGAPGDRVPGATGWRRSTPTTSSPSSPTRRRCSAGCRSGRSRRSRRSRASRSTPASSCGCRSSIDWWMRARPCARSPGWCGCPTWPSSGSVRSSATAGSRGPICRREVYDILLISRLVDAALDMVFLETADDRVEGLATALERVRRSGTLHTLAGFVGCDSDPAREALRERLPDEAGPGHARPPRPPVSSRPSRPAGPTRATCAERRGRGRRRHRSRPGGGRTGAGRGAPRPAGRRGPRPRRRRPPPGRRVVDRAVHAAPGVAGRRAERGRRPSPPDRPRLGLRRPPPGQGGRRADARWSTCASPAPPAHRWPGGRASRPACSASSATSRRLVAASTRGTSCPATAWPTSPPSCPGGSAPTTGCGVGWTPPRASSTS